MRPHKLAAAAAVAVLAATATGCSNDSNAAEKATANEITVRGCIPENELIGGHTAESCGHDIVELFTSTLFRYDPKTAEPVNDLAESVTTTDNQNFTVKIRPGVKFHDGSTVTAKSFVDAWNYTAYGPNGQALQYFMEPFKGYSDVADPKKPKAKTMSGLKVVNDTTFTIQTTTKVANLPLRLGYTAFAPQPAAFFANPSTFAGKPLGAGPYQVDSYVEGQGVTLSKFTGYGGAAAKGNIDKIAFKFYDEVDPAYNDMLSGNLDSTDAIPGNALIDDKYKTELKGRYVAEPFPAINTLIFAPDKVDPAMSNVKLRQAISMAIDRQKIVDDHFQGQRQPATGWVAPGVAGYKAGACGDLCTYNPTKAKELFQQSGFTGKSLTISYNGDGDHRAWTTATCNSIRNALGVTCIAVPIADFASMRARVADQKLKGMWRAGWNADYPHIENFLSPQYATSGSSNDGAYSDETFDGLLARAAAAKGDESIALYQQAEASLAAKMPAIPLWYYTAVVGYSEKLTDVQINKSSGRIDLLTARVAG